MPERPCRWDDLDVSASTCTNCGKSFGSVEETEDHYEGDSAPDEDD